MYGVWEKVDFLTMCFFRFVVQPPNPKYIAIGGGFKYFLYPYLGKIPILTNVFQMGWNHQPDCLY